MTTGFGPHLTPDEFDAWLAAGLDSGRARHLEFCLECQARAEAERALDEQLAALQPLSPPPHFAVGFMQHAAIPQPTPSPSMHPAGRRSLQPRRSVAVAASLAVLLVASMAASVI